jgi:hypothetical protein
MEDSNTNPPPVTAVTPTSLSSAGNSGKPLENAPPVSQTTPLAHSAQVSVPPGQSTAAQIFNWIKKTILAQVNLPEDVAELVAYWIISIWFRDAMTVFPLLAITGPAHEVMVLLRILKDLCRFAGLMAEFKRSDLRELNGSFHTLLISAPNLGKRSAALLGNLTNQGFLIIDQHSYMGCSGSRAIYLGEDPTIKRIPYSIQINITPANAEPPSAPEWLESYIRALPHHLEHYREKNVGRVRQVPFTPSGLASETAVVAKALGSCIVDAPELRQKLVALLKVRDQQHRSQQSGAVEALVVEAALLLSRQARQHAFTSEIADEANRLAKLRGEQPVG